MTEEITAFRRCMKGTNARQPRCMALQGEIGQGVLCTIYADRPTPCREFGVEWVNGYLQYAPEDLDRCTQARAVWGLPPLDTSPPRVRRRVPDYRVALRFWHGPHRPRPGRPPRAA